MSYKDTDKFLIFNNGNDIWMHPSTLQELNEYHNMYMYDDTKEYRKLNRFHLAFPDAEIENTIGHIFFTKPDLNLFDVNTSLTTPRKEILNTVEFNDLFKFNINLLPTLQNSASSSPLINQLCNNVKNFNTKDKIIKTRESPITANDMKIVYGHRINDSISADTIDMSFSDNRELVVYNTLSLWVNYISLIGLGQLTPTSYNRANRILDYAGSIFYFLTSEDGETILYYSKLVGAFPTNIPDSAFTFEFGSNKHIEYNVTFQYSFKDTSPLVISDFNTLFTDYSNPCNVMDSSDYGLTKSTWCSKVHISEEKNCYKLKYYYD